MKQHNKKSEEIRIEHYRNLKRINKQIVFTSVAQFQLKWITKWIRNPTHLCRKY